LREVEREIYKITKKIAYLLAASTSKLNMPAPVQNENI
jgi:hypothetical protein